MSDKYILDNYKKAKENFGSKCSKYRGTLTVELIRQALKKEGFIVSERDVFIKGIPIENDLIISKVGSKPENRILYNKEDVLAVLEIKSRGIWGKSAIDRIRKNFDLIKSNNKNIKCLYMTLSDRKSYKWKATEANINSPAYTLFWHTGPENKLRFEPTGDWTRLVSTIRKITKNI